VRNFASGQALTGQTEEIPMPASQLKRAERAIEKIREQTELPPEAAIALQELVEVIRTIENRLSVLEGKGRIHPTAEMGLPNRR
jgi:uncharacterized membrane protein YccC